MGGHQGAIIVNMSVGTEMVREKRKSRDTEFLNRVGNALTNFQFSSLTNKLNANHVDFEFSFFFFLHFVYKNFLNFNLVTKGYMI